jgi:hypothetical protein
MRDLPDLTPNPAYGGILMEEQISASLNTRDVDGEITYSATI